VQKVFNGASPVKRQDYERLAMRREGCVELNVREASREQRSAEPQIGAKSMQSPCQTDTIGRIEHQPSAGAEHSARFTKGGSTATSRLTTLHGEVRHDHGVEDVVDERKIERGVTAHQAQ